MLENINFADIIICAIILVGIGFALKSCFKKKGGCSSCAGCTGCASRNLDGNACAGETYQKNKQEMLKEKDCM